MLKLFGAVLVLSGTGALHWRISDARRQELRALRETAAALEALARGVQASLAPMPRLLAVHGSGKYADAFFDRVRHLLAAEEEQPFCVCWRLAAEGLPLAPREREIIVSLGAALGGEEESVLRALQSTVQELRSALLEKETARRQESRLAGTLCFGGGLLTVILLL